MLNSCPEKKSEQPLEKTKGQTPAILLKQDSHRGASFQTIQLSQDSYFIIVGRVYFVVKGDEARENNYILNYQ